jgi:transcriptional regulator with XRE-family HTH domain
MGRQDEPRNYLRAWREFRRMTQAQLAAAVGTEGSVISLIESGDRGLSDKWLRRLAPVLHTSPGILLDFHPESVDEATLHQWSKLSKEQKPGLSATRLKDKSSRQRPSPVAEESVGEVVKLPTPVRKLEEVSTSKRNESL